MESRSARAFAAAGAGRWVYSLGVRVLAPVIFLVLALFAAVSLDAPLPAAELVIIERSDCYTLDPQRMSYQHELRRARVLYELSLIHI